MATHLYRIGQECMLNAAKHARARRLKVDLVQDNGQLTLSIEDDGRGFSEETLAEEAWACIFFGIGRG